MKVMCSIYRSKRKQGMYLYVPRKTDMAELPESLMQLFGAAELAMDLVLTEQRTLAREDIHKVLANLESQGYHLQMPPREDEYLIHLPDELLYRNDPI
ncbi:YcgL domain-containing protein [Halopseudomonas salina]|uniref:YcgL domain-containing protein GCM10007418_29530 n=1 Tax=Halopseudomonas salina TaxID=1323744 RepID=A0ABQ1Q1A8_9GAMM|nr:YcgL domain-containing protein [Halopseudomonas salina]GGD08579.1 YcgL domain-containing protein [Halopseudomonas salina]